MQFNEKQYSDGKVNKLIRIYYYLKEGLSVLNDWKYLVAGILAFYYALNLTDYRYMVMMFIVAIPILILLGYVWVRWVRKTMEWFSVKYTTHYAKYGYDLQERRNDLLEQILNKIK